MGGLRVQVIVAVALLLVAPLLVMLYDLRAASRSDDVLVRDLEARLTQVAAGLAAEIEARWGGEPREMPGVFRDVAGPLAAGNPGTRLGLYVVDTGQLFVEGFLHEYRELSPEEQEARERRILREAAAGIASVLAGGQPLTRVGQTWDDHFLEALVPVRVGNRTAAVAWAEQRLHPVFAQRARTRLLLRYAALGTLSVGLLFTMWAVLNFAGQVRRIKEGLGALERDLQHTLPEMPGEMGQIAAAINKMAAGLAEKERQIEQFRRSENLVALGRLVTEIAHELRNPVSIIQAVVQVMGSELGHVAGVGQYVQKVEDQVARHQKMVEELLEFGRPSGAGVGLLDLNDLVRTTVASVEPLLTRRGVGHSFVPAAESLPVEGNGAKLQQVLVNLIMNAVQAMGAGGTLTLRCFRLEDRACVAVEDTGEGIAPEEMARLFVPFHSRKPAGAGLGLAISEQIVKIHGGTIDVASEYGRGTTVRVCLPLSGREVRQNVDPGDR